MAATEISDDVLEDHVKQGIEKWKTGDLYMSVGVKETDKILNPGDSIPEKTDKNHPFIKFLEYIATDIAQTFVLDRTEKKSILRRLQSKSEKWKGLIVPKSEKVIKSPAPKKETTKKEKIKKEKINVSMKKLVVKSVSQSRDEELERAEQVAPVDAKEILDNRLEAKKREFEEARDLILADVPDSVKDRFGKIYFSTWGQLMLPCLVLNPYSVPPGGVRDKWLLMYDKTKGKNRLDFMTNLTYWYGSSGDPNNAYSFIVSNHLISYEVGVKKGFDKIPPAVQKKLDEKKALNSNQRLLVDGLEEMEEDLKKDPKDRRGYMESDWIEAYALSTDDEDNVPDEDLPPIATKKTKKGKGQTKVEVKDETVPKKKTAGTKRKKVEENPVEEEVTPDVPKKTKKGLSKKKKRLGKGASSEIAGFFAPVEEPKTESVAIPQEDIKLHIDENSAKPAQDQPQSIDEKKPDDYAFAMGDSGSDNDSDDEDFQAGVPPADDSTGPAKSKPARPKKQKEAPKKKATSAKHKIDKTVEKAKKQVPPEKQKKTELKKFKSSREEFQPLFNRWKVALDASDTDELVQVFNDMLPLVERIHWALLTLVITQLLKPSRKVLPDARRAEWKQLKEALRSHYEATKQDILPGFDSTEMQLFTEDRKNAAEPPLPPIPDPPAEKEASKNQENAPPADGGSHTATLASPIKRIGSREKNVESSESVNIPQKEVKVERKKFSLGKLMRPTSETAKNVVKSASSEKLSTAVTSLAKKEIPNWVTGQASMEAAPTDDTRSFALEFLQQAVPFIPHSKEVNHDAIAIALEAAIYKKYAMASKTGDAASSSPKPKSEWIDDYWKKIDDIVVAISGDKRNGTISTMIAQGKFESPDKVVQLSAEAIFDSFNGKPVFV